MNANNFGLPEPPEGMYWRIATTGVYYPKHRLILLKKHKYWLDTIVVSTIIMYDEKYKIPTSTITPELLRKTAKHLLILADYSIVGGKK